MWAPCPHLRLLRPCPSQQHPSSGCKSEPWPLSLPAPPGSLSPAAGLQLLIREDEGRGGGSGRRTTATGLNRRGERDGDRRNKQFPRAAMTNHRTSGLERTDFILSQFWRSKVQGQGQGDDGPSTGSGREFPFASSSLGSCGAHHVWRHRSSLRSHRPTASSVPHLFSLPSSCMGTHPASMACPRHDGPALASWPRYSCKDPSSKLGHFVRFQQTCLPEGYSSANASLPLGPQSFTFIPLVG